MNNKGRLAWSLVKTLTGLALFGVGGKGIHWLTSAEDDLGGLYGLVPVFALALVGGVFLLVHFTQELWGEITYARITTGRYTPPNAAKKIAKREAKRLKVARTRYIRELASTKYKDSSYLAVLNKESALARAKGKSWEPPEKYREEYFESYER